jgi:hypothetical protein
MTRYLTLTCALVAALAMPALGQTVAGWDRDGDETPPTQMGPYSYLMDDGDPPAGYVEITGGDVRLDPDAGPIIKVIDTSATDDAHELQIVEFWHVIGPDITDWHEEIIDVIPAPDAPEDWPLWDCGTILVDEGEFVASGLIVEGLGTSALDFYFDPMPECTDFIIEKTIMVPAGVDQIIIEEYPTPEPASMAVLGLGGLAMVLRRRRRAV